MTRPALALLFLILGSAVSGCVAPLLAGATGAVVADEVAEENQGGDGLF
ncbi:MAG: hypothetical protein QNJ13_03415 [Paracoccaceae bacterium]|nr:hypothetical protein [Paracoccaceae bacterium]